jgi:hypothetical protein
MGRLSRVAIKRLRLWQIVRRMWDVVRWLSWQIHHGHRGSHRNAGLHRHRSSRPRTLVRVLTLPTQASQTWFVNLSQRQTTARLASPMQSTHADPARHQQQYREKA